jgi:hypothetical protein
MGGFICVRNERLGVSMLNFLRLIGAGVGVILLVLLVLAKGLSHMGPDAIKAIGKSGDDAISALGKNAGLTDEMIKGSDLKIPVGSPDPLPAADVPERWYAGEAAARAVAKSAQCQDRRMYISADLTPLMSEADEYARSLGYINKGQPVCVDATDDEWSHVQTGWVRSRFLVESP